MSGIVRLGTVRQSDVVRGKVFKKKKEKKVIKKSERRYNEKKIL